MKNTKRIILILTVIAGVVLGSVPLVPAEEGPLESHKSVKAIYRCPMHHQVTSDKPGNCPICGMKLVLISADTSKDAHSEHGAVSITAERQQLMGIKTVTVENRPLKKKIRALGVVSHDEMLYEAELQYIKALYESPKVVKEQYASVYKRPLLPTKLEDAKLKLMQMGIDEETISQIDRNATPDKSLLHLSQHDQDWVTFTLYEYELPFVKKGDKVLVESSSMPGMKLEGEVKSISPFVDAGSRTVKARALVDDAEHRLKPEMSVTVFVDSDLGTAIALPLDAVFLTGNTARVFVEEKEGVFKARPVVVGAQSGEFWEIKEGLMEGEKVAVSGNFLIDSESRMSAASSAS